MHEYKTMTELAAMHLREAVLRGDLKPGTRLIPAKLESEMNLGKMPIREAIRELVGLGVLESLPNKGTYVAFPPSREEINEIYELRLLLEGKAAQKSVDDISGEELNRLEEIYKRMVKETQPKSYFLLNREFHLLLYNASGWNYLCKLIKQLIDQVLLYLSQLPDDSVDLRKYDKDHRGILKSIKAGNAKEVRKGVIENLKRGRENFLKKIS